MKNSLEGHKIQEIKAHYKISPSLSDTHTHTHIHTHTHTHTFNLTHSDTFYRDRKPRLKTKLNNNTECYSICIYCGNCWKNFENNTKNG